MTSEVRVPTLGESVTEATVATWFKKAGDTVAVDEMLCELETDKVTVEVPSPIAGTLSEIVAADPKAKSINQAGGGYGAGYGTASEVHRQVRDWAGSLAYETGMNVVFIGHADTETLDLPDMDPYARYCVRMHKKSIPHYTDNVDLVGLIRLKTFTRGDGDKKRAISTGEREILCFPQASSVTKNRFNITEPLPFTFDGGNPFQQFVAE